MWQEQYERITDSLYAQLSSAVAGAMIAAGEDLENKALFNTRRVQAAYGINSRAQQDDAQRRDEEMQVDPGVLGITERGGSQQDEG